MKKNIVLAPIIGLVMVALTLFPVNSAYAKGAIGSADTGGGKLWEEGTLHDEIIAALASVLNLDADKLEARLKAGEKLMDIATKQGITKEAWPAKMKTAMTTAINKGVANGKITQAQADAILKELEKFGNLDIRRDNGTPPPTPDASRPAPNLKTLPPDAQNGRGPQGQGDKDQGGPGGPGRTPPGSEKIKDMFGGMIF